MISRKKFKNFSHKLILIFILIIFWLWQNRTHSFDGTAVNYLDVGQGDAIYISTDSNHDILIDGGPGQAIAGQLPKVMRSGDKYIDLMILTHPHADHVSGLVWVLENYYIGKVILTKVEYKSGIYSSFLESIKTKKIETVTIDGPRKYTFDQNTYFEILGPTSDYLKLVGNDINHTSISARLVDGENSFFFGGDIESSEEEWLVKTYGQHLDSDVMLAPHHGSNTSSTNRLIETITPDFAVISSGEGNKYGHPHQDILQRYHKLNIPLLRTDQIGVIRFISNGEEIILK